jgi:AcrR family transcriptional regulator
MTETLSRQERRKQRTRRKLLDAARRMIARHGYDPVGILDITEAADVSKGTFYLHFADKEELTRTLMMEGFEAMRARIDKVLVGESRLGHLADALREMYQYAVDNRELFQIMLGRQVSAELNMLATNYYAEVVEDILTKSGIDTEIYPFPPAILAQFVAGACVRLGVWWMEDHHGLSTEEIGDITYRLLRDGVLSMLPPDIRPIESIED